MKTLQVRLLGELQLLYDGVPLPAFPTDKSRALFAFLILHQGRLIPRNALVAMLWGDHPRALARASLQAEVLRICSVMRALPAPYGACLQVLAEEVGFAPADGQPCVDVTEFERCVHEANARVGVDLSEEQADLLGRAVRLYAGDLVQGLEDDWCSGERQRLRLMYVAALEALIPHHQARGERDRAAALEQRLSSARSAPLHRLELCDGPRPSTTQAEPAGAPGPRNRASGSAAEPPSGTGRPMLRLLSGSIPPLFDQVQSVLAGLRAARHSQPGDSAPAGDPETITAAPFPPPDER